MTVERVFVEFQLIKNFLFFVLDSRRSMSLGEKSKIISRGRYSSRSYQFKWKIVRGNNIIPNHSRAMWAMFLIKLDYKD